jgi:hypothetical protein
MVFDSSYALLDKEELPLANGCCTVSLEHQELP